MSVRYQKPSRRRFLELMSGAGAASIFAPLLLPQVAEAQAAPPLRYVQIATMHGKDRAYWDPKGLDTAFDIDFQDATLRPLQPFKSKLLVMMGLDYKVLMDTNKTGHNGGPVTCFTGTAPAADSYYSTAAGPSLDVFLAERLGGTTAVRSVQLANHGDYCSDDSYLSFSASGQKLPNLYSPRTVYDRLFGGYVPPTAMVDPTLQRRSLVDFWLRDANRLRAKLAAPEQQKLDVHLSGLRDIERRIEASAPPPATCSPPTAPRNYPREELAGCFDEANERTIPERTMLMMDILAQALACDRTRFAGIRISPGLKGLFDTFLVNPSSQNIHTDLAHQRRTSADAAARLNRVNTWNAQMVAHLLGRMNAVSEGGGTLLDHSLVLWGNELGDAGGHTNDDMPFVIAGGCNGKLRMGRALRFAAGTPHNRLLCSVANAFEQGLSGYGATGYAGELTGMT